MEKKRLMLPVLAVLVIFAVLAISAIGFGGNYLPQANEDYSLTSIEYNSNVCIKHLDSSGEVLSEECDHNVLYNTGKDLIELYLGDTGGGTDEVDQISLCNATAGCGTPVAAASETFNTYTTCGLAEATGTYASVGTGNWTIATTFTASCDNLLTNSTRLQNTAGTNFAGNTFTLVTLQSGDQLQVIWNIWVS